MFEIVKPAKNHWALRLPLTERNVDAIDPILPGGWAGTALAAGPDPVCNRPTTDDHWSSTMTSTTTTSTTTTGVSRFVDRADAGRRLAATLADDPRLSRRDGPGIVVVGLPRGGVPVAESVADELRAPLDVIVVRKLGVPFQQELAMGAVGEGGVVVLNDDVVAHAHVTPEEIGSTVERERAELVARADRLRRDRARMALRGRHVVIVDDGIATGATARAACQVARASGAAEVTLAVPVAPAGWVERLGSTADRYVAVLTPSDFHAVGQFYDDFRSTSDDEVIAILDAHTGARASHVRRPDPPAHENGVDVRIRVDHVSVTGRLVVPPDPIGLVVFAHGSGSSRHSPRNRFVAEVLQDARLATLLFDLLTPDEERRRTNVFDIGLLTDRLVEVVRWARSRPDLAELPIGLFGSSTGAAAALSAAATLPDAVKAVVSRGGRPDLAADAFGDVRAPTLLVVGGADTVVLGLNRQALAALRTPALGTRCELSVVPGATHLFEEPGALRMAAEVARDWFVEHLPSYVPTPQQMSRAR
jgi:putative phosphoribosyl transferase